MSLFHRTSLRSAALGVLSAFTLALPSVAAAIFFLTENRTVLEALARIASVFVRLGAPLVIAGALAGMLYLDDLPNARVPLRVLRWAASGFVSCFLAVLGLLALLAIRSGYFHLRVVAPSFDASATESDVRARLGQPKGAETAPEFVFIGNDAECLSKRPARNLIYIQPGGGTYRVLYFSADGQFACDTTGQIYY